MAWHVWRALPRSGALPSLAASVFVFHALALTSVTPDHVAAGAAVSELGARGLKLHSHGEHTNASVLEAHEEFDRVLRKHAMVPTSRIFSKQEKEEKPSPSHGGRSQLVSRNDNIKEIHMLVSLYLPEPDLEHQEHAHVREMLAAFNVNLENPVITSIHVLLEAPGRNCSALPDAVDKAINRRLTVEDLDRVHCKTVAEQPTYADFFQYANTSMSKTGVVLLANADIVFDGSLRKMTRPKPGEEGQLISVRAPPYSGEFRSIFQKRCTEVLDKCTRVTKSWDAYAFSLPLVSSLNEYDLQFTMNVFTADHRAAYALHESGMRLTNPCMHINAFHFHCFSGKMHSRFRDEGNLTNLTRKSGIYMKSYPCADFPEDKCVVEKLVT